MHLMEIYKPWYAGLRRASKAFPVIIKLHKRYWRYRTLMNIGWNYLDPLGYFNEIPSDAAGNPLPWFSYSAISFLESIVQKRWKVFEYGSGYSTVFWNTKCGRTVSVEHDEYWFNILRRRYSNFEIYFVKEGADRQRQVITDLIDAFEAIGFDLPLSSDQAHNRAHGLLNREFADYAAKLVDFPKGFFDVIVVDGMARSLCLFLAAEYISESGIIILDDSDRWQYNDLQQHLIMAKNFNRLDFSSLTPKSTREQTTSIFFKDIGFLRASKTIRKQGAGHLGW